MYLRPSSAEVAFAVPTNGAIIPPGIAPVQVGRIADANPKYEPGFRVGFRKAFDDCSSLTVTYSWFESNAVDAIVVDPAVTPLRAMVLHPGTANAAANFASAAATNGVDFQLVDADYRAVWCNGNCWAINYLFGVRYAHLDQDFRAEFLPTGGPEFVQTAMTFDGGGLRVGIDGERHVSNGWLFYGRSTASFVAGQFHATYLQGNVAQPVLVNTSWTAGRVVTMLDLELGAGWQSPCGKWRLTAGYLVNGWFNAVTTNDWIGAVQTNNVTNLGDGLSFDGLVSRVEYRF